MDKEKLFQIFLYDYIKKRGLSNTAEIFRNEARVTGQIPAEYDQEPHGFFYFWVTFYNKYKSRQPMPGPYREVLLNFQAPNVGAVMNTTSQIIQEGYFIRHLASFRSGETLLSCDFSSDGNIVASGGLGRKPFICYIESRDSVTTSETHLSAILEVRFQPASPIFATSSADRTVKLWDAERPKKALYDLAGHNWIVRSLDFHPLQEILCSSSTHDGIKLWDLNQRVIINNVKERGRQVRFQPGYGSLLAVSNRNVITIFDTQDFSVFIQLKEHVKDINSICWDVTGEMIASVTEDDVRVSSVLMGRECIYKYPSNGKRFQSVIFHPRHPNVLVIGGFHCLELLILENGQTSSGRRASDLSITGLAATVTGNEIIASVSNDSVVKIWE